ncbi:MAG: hypothetical protein ACR2G6_07355, partial [Gemmatimonadaceae bacterium]
MSAPVARPGKASAAAPKSQPARTASDTPVATTRAAGLSGFNGNRRVPAPVNEPVRSYAPGSPEKRELKARLESMSNERIEIPLVIGGRDVRTGELAQAVMPHAHRHV